MVDWTRDGQGMLAALARVFRWNKLSGYFFQPSATSRYALSRITSDREKKPCFLGATIGVIAHTHEFHLVLP